MITMINNKGVWVKYKPFHKNYRFYPWNEIEKAYDRIYQPLKEYGGYGIRFRSKIFSGAFNVSGNIGLQLEMKNGRKVLIETMKGNEIKGIPDSKFNQN